MEINNNLWDVTCAKNVKVMSAGRQPHTSVGTVISINRDSTS